jgi:ABC-2 type transport system permease protein
VIAELEIRVALAQRRLFVLNTLVPLALVVPIGIGGAPRVHAAVVFTLIFAFFGVFGQAIPLARDAERGLTARFVLAGVSPHAFFAQRIAAHAGIDFIQLTPALLVIAIVYNATASDIAALAGAALLALVAANAIGILIAAAARSIAEAALFASITALFALHAAGVFRSPAPGSFADQLRSAVPFSRLHQAMQGAVGSPGAAPPDWLAAGTSTVAICALVLLLAPLLAGALTRARAG